MKATELNKLTSELAKTKKILKKKTSLLKAKMAKEIQSDIKKTNISIQSFAFALNINRGYFYHIRKGGSYTSLKTMIETKKRVSKLSHLIINSFGKMNEK